MDVADLDVRVGDRRVGVRAAISAWLVVLNRAGRPPPSRPTPLFELPASAEAPAWSRRSSRCVFPASAGGRLGWSAVASAKAEGRPLQSDQKPTRNANCASRGT